MLSKVAPKSPPKAELRPIVAAVVPAFGESPSGRWAASRVGERSLLATAVETARAARRVDKVVAAVTEIDKSTAAAAAEAGVELCLVRELRGGKDLDREAARQVLATIKADPGTSIETVVIVGADSPVRRPADIDESIQALTDQNVDEITSVVRVRTTEPGETVAIPNGCVRALRRRALEVAVSRNFAYHEMEAASLLRVGGPLDLTDIAAVLAARRRELSRASLADIGLIVFDFDGVFTDNRVLVMQDGTEGVLCSRGDGMGLEMLRKTGMPLVVVSKEQNPVVAARCRKLKLECVQGVDDKLPEVKRQAENVGVVRERVAYVGNDVNDLEPMGWVGMPIAVADAHPEAIRAARLVLARPGGIGAIRELCEMVMAARGGK